MQTTRNTLSARKAALLSREDDPQDLTRQATAENIRSIRYYLDLTLPEVALLLGKRSQLTIMHYEQGATPIPQSTWERLCGLVHESQQSLLLRIYGSAHLIPRHRRGARLTTILTKPLRRKHPASFAPGTGRALHAIRTAARLPVSAVATLAFPGSLAEKKVSEVMFRKIESNKRISCETAATVLNAIQAALQSRRALALGSLERSAENLRTLRKAFGLSQADIAEYMGAERKRGLVYSYESGKSPLPARCWAPLVAKLGSIERSIASEGEVDAAIAAVAASIARHREDVGADRKPTHL